METMAVIGSTLTREMGQDEWFPHPAIEGSAILARLPVGFSPHKGLIIDSLTLELEPQGRSGVRATSSTAIEPESKGRPGTHTTTKEAIESNRKGGERSWLYHTFSSFLDSLFVVAPHKSASASAVRALPGASSLGFVIEMSLAELLSLSKGSTTFDLIVLIAKEAKTAEKAAKNVIERHLSMDGVVVVVSGPNQPLEEMDPSLLTVPPSQLVKELYPTDLTIVVRTRHR